MKPKNSKIRRGRCSKMIIVNLWRNKEGYINQYRVDGHADKDLVCAAVSAITQTAVFGLNKICKHKIRFESAPGLLHVTLQQAPDRMTQCVLGTMLEGLLETQKQYKDAIYITDGIQKG